MTESEYALALASQMAEVAARGGELTLSPTDLETAAKALRAWAEVEALKRAAAC